MIERPLCGLRGFIKRDVSVAMEDEGADGSLGPVVGCGVDWTGGRMGILDDDVAWLRYGWKEFRG